MVQAPGLLRGWMALGRKAARSLYLCGHLLDTDCPQGGEATPTGPWAVPGVGAAQHLGEQIPEPLSAQLNAQMQQGLHCNERC